MRAPACGWSLCSEWCRCLAKEHNSTLGRSDSAMARGSTYGCAHSSLRGCRCYSGRHAPKNVPSLTAVVTPRLLPDRCSATGAREPSSDTPSRMNTAAMCSKTEYSSGAAIGQGCSTAALAAGAWVWQCVGGGNGRVGRRACRWLQTHAIALSGCLGRVQAQSRPYSQEPQSRRTCRRGQRAHRACCRFCGGCRGCQVRRWRGRREGKLGSRARAEQAAVCGSGCTAACRKAGINLRQPNEASACPAELAAPDGGRWGTPAARAAQANNDAGACLMQGLSTGSDRSNIQIYS